MLIQFTHSELALLSLQRCLSNSEDECTHLRNAQQQAQAELVTLAASHQTKVEEVNEVMEKLQVGFTRLCFAILLQLSKC